MTPGGQARQVREIMARYPLLSMEGHGLSNCIRRTPEERQAGLAREREELASPESAAEIAAAADWIAEHWAPRKTLNTWHTSYGLKHVYEAAAGQYVTNGQFIVAMLLAGFTARMDHLNPYFNLSERSVSATRQDNERHGKAAY
jgi:hypothetical protein